MATVKNADRHQRPIALTGGRQLAPGEEASGVDVEAANEAAWIAEGSLVVTDGTNTPPAPAAVVVLLDGVVAAGWDSEHYFPAGVVARDSGGSFVALKGNVGHKPSTSPEYWYQLDVDGSTGQTGADGKTVRHGTGAPSSGLGVDGDFYIEMAEGVAVGIYGPKASGAWGSSTPLRGPEGPTIKATTTVAGVSKLSKAPASEANPIALGANEKGAAGGVASLDEAGLLPTSQLPPLALTDPYVVASQAAQLALTVQKGDFAIRTDTGKTYVHNGGVAGTMADWTELVTPGAVTTVNGHTGTVSLVAADVGAIPTSAEGAASGVATLTAGSIGAQPPAHHASTHAEGGTDALTLADLPSSVVNGSAAAANTIPVANGSGGYAWTADTIWHVSTATPPANGLGAEGDMCFNPTTNAVYGPKASGGSEPWGVPKFIGTNEISVGAGLPGEVVPQMQAGLWANTTRQLAANRAFLMRWRPVTARSVIHAVFNVTLAATANDKVDIGVYSINEAGTELTRIVSLGETASLLNPGTVPALSTVSLAGTFEPGKTYVVALACGPTAAPATLAALGLQSAVAAKIFGETWPYALAAFKDSAFPLPATISTPTYGSIGSFPVVTLLEV